MIGRFTLLFALLFAVVVPPVWGQGSVFPMLPDNEFIDLRPLPDFEIIPQTIWRAPLDSSGDWFDSELWTSGTPDADTDAVLINGSETLLNGGLAQARSLRLQFPGGGRSRLTQSGGRLEVTRDVSVGDGVYRQVGGELSAGSLTLGSSPIIRIDPSWADIPLLNNPFIITRVFPPRQIPFEPIVSYELVGGVADVQGAVTVNTGLLSVSGGRLEAGSIRLDAPQIGIDVPVAFVPQTDFLSSLPAQADFPSPPRDGIIQSGGAVAVNGELTIQDGTYSLSGGELTVGTLAIGDPLDTPTLFFRLPRSPEFVQTGGVLVVNENLELCQPGIVLDPGNGIEFIPSQPFNEVVYRLEAGEVNVAGNTTVGSLGVAPALFLQSGGTFNTAGTLRIEGETSRYEITGGELRAGVLEIGVEEFNNAGTLAIGSAGRVLIEDRVTLGDEAAIEAEVGAIIELAGGAFEITGPVTSRLAGLENTALVITGGDEVSTLEAVSVDVGKVAGGFLANAAWGMLRIGSESETGILELIDAIDNAPAATPEAVYVDTLFVGEGSTLDLGGLNLYYREAVVLGEVVTSGGALRAIAIPEPAVITLLATAIGLSAAARRRR